MKKNKSGRKPKPEKSEALPKAPLPGKATYILSSDINPGITLDISQFLHRFASKPQCEIEIIITSPGGDPDCAFAIYDTIRAVPNRVTTVASGHASSAATIVFLAGDHRMIMPNAFIRMHTPIYFSDSEQRASLQDMELRHNDMRNLFSHILDIFADRTGRDLKTLRALCRRNKRLNANEAMKYGFAHEIGYLPKDA